MVQLVFPHVFYFFFTPLFFALQKKMPSIFCVFFLQSKKKRSGAKKVKMRRCFFLQSKKKRKKSKK
jgi:hypothetical protein